MVDKVLLSKKANITEKKTLIKFIPPIDDAIQNKLHSIANKGYGVGEPTIIKIEEIEKAISEWKMENNIFSQDITMLTCTELALSFNKILKISNLDNLLKLEKLKLDNNMIMKIENLDHLVNIKWLDLSFNYITKIENLEKLTELTDLSLFSNQISDVEGLDTCLNLNILSIGKNSIKNPKEMVDYLRKFGHLQALNINDNPFCRDEGVMQISPESTQQQKTNYFPSSYDVVIATLDRLKYLDWKPIDEDVRVTVTDSYKNNNNQKERSDFQYRLEENKQKELMKENEDLRRANAEDIIDLYKQIEKIYVDGSNQQSLDNLKAIKRLDNLLKLLEKFINDTLAGYKEAILLDQKDKEDFIKLKIKEIDQGQEKFVQQSKDLVSKFKRDFKERTLNKSPYEINRDKIDSNIKELVTKLLEIEVWEKQKIKDLIEKFRAGINSINEKMSEKSSKLKEELDNYKNSLRNNLTNLNKTIEEEITAYTEPDNPNHKNIISMDNKEMEIIKKIWFESDLQSDVDRIIEAYEEKVSNIKDQLDNARSNATNEYFDRLNEKEFLRSKKRIEDINEISEMYSAKLISALEKN